MASEFDRLPRELIISIFEKILDARCLFMCYSVCKQFATLVRQTRFVSVRIPSVIGSFSTVPVWPPGILKFLRKLSRLESATIHFSLHDPDPRRSEPLSRWKSDSSRFIFLFCENCVEFDDSTCNDDDDDGDECLKEFPLFEENSSLFAWMEDQLHDSRLRVLYVEELIPLFPNLKSVEAVDSIGRGRHVLDEKGISRVKENHFRTISPVINVWEVDPMGQASLILTRGNCSRQFWIRRWSATQVKLPFSGCVMKEVTLITVGETNDCNRLTEENWFEETEYREVAATMMKKYRCIPVDVMISARTFADAAIFEGLLAVLRSLSASRI